MLDRIHSELREKTALLRRWQNSDGGIPAYVVGDASGAWTTAEVLSVVLEHIGSDFDVTPADVFVGGLARFLTLHQNPDGGWPYRDRGQSFVDPSAWCALALVRVASTPGECLARALDFLLDSRWRAGEWNGGWGIQREEFARTYSTGIAAEALSRLVDDDRVRSGYPRLHEAEDARRGALEFMRRTRNAQGGWGARPGASSDAGSTACALHALCAAGARLAQYRDSLTWLLAQRVPPGEVWESLEEVLPLRSGLEVTQQWFVHPECVNALCSFSESGLLDVGSLAEAVEASWRFVDADGRLCYVPETVSKDYTWLVPFHLRALARARRCLEQRRPEYDAYVAARQALEREQRRRALAERVYRDYPFPVAEPFSRFDREDDPMRRLRGLLDCTESLIILIASLAVASLAEWPERSADSGVLRLKEMSRTGAGHWLGIARRIAKLDALAATEPVVARIASTFAVAVCDVEGQELSVSDALGQLVSARNAAWGHGALATAFEYDQHGQRLRPLLEATLAAFDWFAEHNLFYVTRTDEDEWGEQSVYTVVNCRGLRFGDRARVKSTRRLHTGGEVRPLYWGGTRAESTLNLFPLWHFGPCVECRGHERFFCHQDLDEQGAWYLSYECGHRTRLDNRARFNALFKQLGPRN